MSIRVAVVDDQALVRGGFAMVLRIHDDIEVVAEAGTGLEAIEVARRHRPDVVLMDIRMPDMDGLEATSRILAEADWDVRVLILTTFDPDEYVYKALRAGASGFVLKDIPPDQLAIAVRTVADGGALLAPSITRRLIGRFTERMTVDAAVAGRLERLTDREREVVVAVARGSSNAEIAERALHRAGDRQVARVEHPDQARPARPHPARGVRLRERPGRGRRPGHRPLTTKQRCTATAKSAAASSATPPDASTGSCRPPPLRLERPEKRQPVPDTGAGGLSGTD